MISEYFVNIGIILLVFIHYYKIERRIRRLEEKK